jgi:hypothetical protein
MHDLIVEVGKTLWREASYVATHANSIGWSAQRAIHILHCVPGMTQAHDRDFKRANPIFNLKDGTVVKIWKNPVGVEHIFLANAQREMIFGGFVGWVHSGGLHQAIEQIYRECA